MVSVILKFLVLPLPSSLCLYCLGVHSARPKKQIFTLNEGTMQNKAHRLQKLELRKLPERIQDHCGGATPVY